MIKRIELENYQKQLISVLSWARKVLETPPIGRLEITLKGDTYQYRKRYEENGECKRTYLRKKDRKIAAEIAQRDYARQIEKLAPKEIEAIGRLLDIYDHTNTENCHENLHPGRRCLVKPQMMTDDEYAQQWMTKRSNEKISYDLPEVIRTERGELVRSKSEMIIANKLYLKGIPYKYEEPINVGGSYLFPDFTILRKSTRKVIYWEHLGRLDFEDYREKTIQKIATYAKAGIVMGDNLIITMESKQNPLSTIVVQKIVESLI